MLGVLVIVIAHAAAHVATRDDDEVVTPGPAHLVLHRHTFLLPTAPGGGGATVGAVETDWAMRAKDLNEMFPVAEAEAAAPANPRGFMNLLCKQLDHLGNARFDPALFRVDAYGNVLYLHADTASPLAWDIDHWFHVPK
uniref:rRNA N-glycosidase n=1 Tax=Oryza barthii TaxID=65489 RepID=A0A0D3G7J1_9ORYZ